LGARAKIEVPMYEGNLNVEELLDWIRSMDKYFDYEDVDGEKRVRHVVTRIKGHTTLWSDELQAKRRSRGKQKIKNWDIMVSKMKAKFMPKYYQINLFRKMHNLRQKGLTIKEYTEEFYKLNIRTEQRERDEEKVARYINGLRYEIQDEINTLSVRTVEDAYQFALKVEDKLARKQIQRGRGKISVPDKGKGVAHDKEHKSKDETEKPHSHLERGGSS
jgi:DNA-binding transcriptional MerR regulator